MVRTASEHGRRPAKEPAHRNGPARWLRRSGQSFSTRWTAGWALVLSLLLSPGLATAQRVPTVFACEPEWAALVKVLLPGAKIHVATHAAQDPHHIEARPALIAQLRSADLAVCTGADLEAGWLPMLQQRAANPRVQNGQPGLFFAADAVRLIEPASATLNPFAGDVHVRGNPHLHADPERLAQVAQALAQHLGRLWPEDAVAISRHHAEWAARWAAHTERWRREGRRLQGLRVATQHSTFGYLWHWLGVQVVADLEPRPGMPPTPGHLERLRSQLMAHPPALIVLARHHDARPARWLAQQLDGRTPVRVWPATVEDPAQPDALARWLDNLLGELLAHAPASR